MNKKIILIFAIIFSIISYYIASASFVKASDINQKICWGIKRNDNHEQPDLGKENKELITKYNGLAMGNNTDKYIYLTFDLGYEAGYTEKILDVLKENDVKACFFITAHYLNTAQDLVKRMIEEGHDVGNHTPNYLMSGRKV